MCYTHTMEYYSSIKENEIVIHAKMDEFWKHYAKCRKRDTKVTYTMIPFIWNVHISQSEETESIVISSCLGPGWGAVIGSHC